MTANETLVASAQAAALLKVSERTMRRWRDTGEGPPFKRLPDGQALYARSDIHGWLTTQCVVSIIYAPIAKAIAA
jgi:DNA-binding transcriptional MerR regulator